MTDFSGPETLDGISDPQSLRFDAAKRYVGRIVYEVGPDGEVLSEIRDFSDGYTDFRNALEASAELKRRSRVILYEGETAVDAHLRIQEARGFTVAPQFANVSMEQGKDI